MERSSIGQGTQPVTQSYDMMLNSLPAPSTLTMSLIAAAALAAYGWHCSGGATMNEKV